MKANPSATLSDVGGCAESSSQMPLVESCNACQTKQLPTEPHWTAAKMEIQNRIHVPPRSKCDYQWWSSWVLV